MPIAQPPRPLANPPANPALVRARTLARRPDTLAPGTRLPASRIGTRTFLTARFGVALGAGSDAQYPVRTTDGGQTWRTDGPALHIDAANAPFAVSVVAAATPRLQYAYGDGQVADVTADGGATWRTALFQGIVMAVVPAQGVTLAHPKLVAFVDSDAGSILQYTSTDGGRSWRRNHREGG